MNVPDGCPRFWWRARLIAKGPYIGVLTMLAPPLVDGEWLDRSPRWQAVVRLETTGRAILLGDRVPIEVDGVFLRNVEEIAEADYLYLIRHAEYATNHAPHMPDAAPTTAIDWNQRKAIF